MALRPWARACEGMVKMASNGVEKQYLGACLHNREQETSLRGMWPSVLRFCGLDLMPAAYILPSYPALL